MGTLLVPGEQTGSTMVLVYTVYGTLPVQAVSEVLLYSAPE